MKFFIACLLLFASPFALGDTCALSCPAGATLIGQCSPTCPNVIPPAPTCQAPSTIVNGVCTAPTTPADPAKCDPKLTAKPYTTLTRMCAGLASYPSPWTKFNYQGAFVDLGSILGGGSWGTYKARGYPFTIAIPTGQFIAFAFTPTNATQSLQLGANTTFGDGGTISISTSPGVMTTAAGALCSYSRNGSNNLTVLPIAGYTCSVKPNQVYYVNIADVDASGGSQCRSGAATCQNSSISYTSNY